MSQQKYPKAYEAYQQAVYRDGRNPTFWCSIGVLYYQINQYRDALDAYSRAIRLNPYISEVWYDLGTLVRLRSSCYCALSIENNANCCFSTSHATTKSMMPWMHINALLSSILPMFISRLASSCCAAARLLARPALLCLKMSIPRRTRIAALSDRQVPSGATLRRPRLQLLPPAPR
jgi:tetratricopeptide (TPR) repeat protein